jgi:hypothetical protein
MKQRKGGRYTPPKKTTVARAASVPVALAALTLASSGLVLPTRPPSLHEAPRDIGVPTGSLFSGPLAPGGPGVSGTAPGSFRELGPVHIDATSQLAANVRSAADVGPVRIGGSGTMSANVISIREIGSVRI